MYWVVLGSSSEMSFSAIGMKAPGLASAAPAPRIATARDEETFSICAIMPAVRAGLGGRRIVRTTRKSRATAAITSTTATHVFGVLGVCDAATLPMTNAATIPIPSVAPRAPK